MPKGSNTNSVKNGQHKSSKARSENKTKGKLAKNNLDLAVDKVNKSRRGSNAKCDETEEEHVSVRNINDKKRKGVEMKDSDTPDKRG